MPSDINEIIKGIKDEKANYKDYDKIKAILEEILEGLNSFQSQGETLEYIDLGVLTCIYNDCERQLSLKWEELKFKQTLELLGESSKKSELSADLKDFLKKLKLYSSLSNKLIKGYGIEDLLSKENKIIQGFINGRSAVYWVGGIILIAIIVLPSILLINKIKPVNRSKGDIQITLNISDSTNKKKLDTTIVSLIDLQEKGSFSNSTDYKLQLKFYNSILITVSVLIIIIILIVSLLLSIVYKSIDKAQSRYAFFSSFQSLLYEDKDKRKETLQTISDFLKDDPRLDQ